jgi:hypothetical protein
VISRQFARSTERLTMKAATRQRGKPKSFVPPAPKNNRHIVKVFMVGHHRHELHATKGLRIYREF